MSENVKQLALPSTKERKKIVRLPMDVQIRIRDWLKEQDTSVFTTYMALCRFAEKELGIPEIPYTTMKSCLKSAGKDITHPARVERKRGAEPANILRANTLQLHDLCRKLAIVPLRDDFRAAVVYFGGEPK